MTRSLDVDVGDTNEAECSRYGWKRKTSKHSRARYWIPSQTYFAILTTVGKVGGSAGSGKLPLLL